MYITGGIGSSHYGEAFTYDYDLPNDTVYNETCAAIALVFFAQRMLNIAPKGEYGDVLEQALYNGVISGMSVDGKSFFYVNPLEVVPEASEKDQLHRHVKTERQKWFGCSCCPPNLARLVASLGSYAYSKGGDVFYLNLFAGGTVNTQLASGALGLAIETEYPWEKTVTIKVTEAPASAVLAVRIPGWCSKYTLSKPHELKDGYAMISGLKAGDVVELILDMPVVMVEANPRVREDAGKVAVRRGPVVYCIEEADNGTDLHRVRLPENAKFECSYDANFFDGATLIQSSGKKLDQSSWDADELYRETQAIVYEDVVLKWIPYYLWANRGAGEMTVWVRRV
jgi:DUF1680 family protein